MENINKEAQLAIEKVLIEMEHAEEILNSWHAYWYEEYGDVVFPKEYAYDTSWKFFLSLEEQNELEKINQANDVNEIEGIPLKSITFGDNHRFDISKIEWHTIKTNNSFRRIVFNHNGDIEFSKYSHKKQTKRHPTQIEYNANYNVLSNDFQITFTTNQLTDESNIDTEITISLKGCILTKKYNDIEIIHDLNTGKKLIRIIKEHNRRNKESNASVSFEALLNQDNNLERSSVVINTHKASGKINGTYRFDASQKRGVRINFYSRKGQKIDLTTNNVLLKSANSLLLAESTNNAIVPSFTNSTSELAFKNLSFDKSSFNITAIEIADKETTEILKTIIGELPLLGLTERINNCLNMIESIQNNQSNKKARVLIPSLQKRSNK